MNLFSKVGNGFSLMWNSLFLPFYIPRIYLYFIIVMIIGSIGYSFLIPEANSFLLVGYNVLLTSFFNTFGVFFMAGVFRSIINAFNGKKESFWDSVYLSTNQIWYYFVAILFYNSIYLYSIFASVYFGFIVTLLLIPFFILSVSAFALYLPTLMYHNKSFWENIATSFRLFWENIIEIISSFFVIILTIMGFVLFLNVSMNLLGQSVRTALIQAINLKNITLLYPYPSILFWIICNLIVLFFILCGVFAWLPSLYYYATNNKNNPFRD